MTRFQILRDRLPTLYRPEEGDDSLLTQFLRAVAGVLDEADLDAAAVMQAHWSPYADRALFSAYFRRGLALGKKPVPLPNDPSLAAFPYIRDLGRLAALLPLLPWREPPELRELVEAYRLRIRRIVTLHANGLGTPQAVRRMVEANLPTDLQAPADRRDRPFELEEFAPLVTRSLAVSQPGEHPDMVGPLMRWTLQNDGMEAVAPTILIQGVASAPGVDATTRPEIEIYSAGSARLRLGIGYSGTLAPGQTLRLRPAYASWLGSASGVAQAESRPADDAPADSTAPGPWLVVDGTPVGAVAALAQSQDRVLWAAVNGESTGALWRFNGQAWEMALADLPIVECLFEDEQVLLIGTVKGLMSVSLYPEGAFVATTLAAVGAQTVHAIFRSKDGTRWLGTSAGLFTLDSLGAATPFVLGDSQETATPVYAISQDATGTMYFGTELGLFQHQPATGHWYWYEGDASTDQAPDWQRLRPEASGADRNFPSVERVHLPAVRCVHRGPDASLWLGTEAGIARYVARAVRGLTYQTILEAFPDLLSGAVHAIREDARGNVWFCTERGLFRYDGRDMWHLESGAWLQLGRADTLYGAVPSARGHWRYLRDSSQWQRFDLGAGKWANYTDGPRTQGEAAVTALEWTDGVAADLGTWDGSSFTSVTPVESTTLVVRFKPEETRIVTGGIPASPRLPVGASMWRYLMIEPADLVEQTQRPSWTVEGRLLMPPSDLPPPPPGRYNIETPPNVSRFAEHAEQAVFAYNPSARVWFQWEARRPLTALARLKRISPSERIDPAVLDRVWQGIQQVRPAGVRAMLAVEEQIVRGK